MCFFNTFLNKNISVCLLYILVDKSNINLIHNLIKSVKAKCSFILKVSDIKSQLN